MESIKTIKYRGHEIKILPDEQPMEDPNDWNNDQVFLIHHHREFSTAPPGMDPEDAYGIFDSYIREKRKTYVIGDIRYWVFPVYAYIHGGVSLHMSRRSANRGEPTGFDTSFKGFALVSKNEPKFWNFDEALEAAESLLKTWNMYLSGQVYGYVSDCGSCWGYYGEEGIQQAIDEAKAEIDYVVDQKNKERIRRLKNYIKSKVPFEYRKLEPVL